MKPLSTAGRSALVALAAAGLLFAGVGAGTANADVTVQTTCRHVAGYNPSRGAYGDADLCWWGDGAGHFNSNTTGYVKDTEADGAGAVFQLKYTDTAGTRISTLRRIDGNGNLATFDADRDHIWGLYARVCLINAAKGVHSCSEWA